MPNAGELCNREVVVAHRTDGIVHAAALMRDRHVGDIVVIENRNGMRVPVGLVTDRDIVVGVLAPAEPYVDQITLGDVLVRPLSTASEDEDILHVARRMHLEGVRRLPVVDKQGGLVGIISMDDVLALLAETLLDISAVSGRQRRREQKQRG